MKNWLYIIALLFVFKGNAFSQAEKRHFRQHELGILLGGAYYIGDLNPAKHFYSPQPAGSIYYRFTPNYRYAFRTGLTYASVLGDDSQSDNQDQLQRNLNFKSKLYEFNIISEFNFLEYRISQDKYRISTYLFLGLGVFNFNPQAQIGNEWYDLQPLRTEGQSKKYKRTQVNIPFGIGLKLNVSKNVGIGLEWGPRKLFTDYLDDVSGTYPNTIANPLSSPLANKLSDRSKNAGSNINEQRGNPRTKDWYYVFGVSLNFKLTPKPEQCHAYQH